MEEAVAQIIRVSGPGTLQCRVWCPMMHATATVYCAICGITQPTNSAIVDWAEIHGDRAKLVTYDWMRDEYGRLLIDLADLQSGEVLSQYLVSSGVSEPRPHHLSDAFHALLTSEEPDDEGWRPDEDK